ncbi:MAG TPA: DUF5302 domain-containing protein [Mycobacteriales bacterium]|nr:DUF5302 domain-containing protein [Mycobacteriales bacterium]
MDADTEDSAAETRPSVPPPVGDAVADGPGAAGTNADDELRQRYRDALERKRARGGAGGAAHQTGSAVGRSETAGPRRTFRRKAGS